MIDVIDNSLTISSKTIVVFIHGFMGSSEIFEYLLPTVEEFGYAFDFITLSGHGGTVMDFFKTPSKEWALGVESYIDKIRLVYDNIILVTHSMGGLIAVNHLVNNSEKVSHVISLALPVNIHVTPRFIKTCLLYVFHKDSTDKYVQATSRHAGVSGIKIYNSPLLLPKVFAFFRQARLAKRNISKFSVPITVINSSKDELVSIRSLRHIKKIKEDYLNLIELEYSGHFWHDESEREIMREAVMSAFKQVSGGTK